MKETNIISIRGIIKNEGYKALYKGIVPNLYKDVFF